MTLVDSEDSLRTNEMMFETLAELYQARSAVVEQAKGNRVSFIPFRLLFSSAASTLIFL